MKRSHQVLGGLLLLQLALILLLRSPFARASQGVDSHPLLQALQGTSPTRVELSGAEEGERVTLVKAGDDWKIENMEGFPADGTKVQELVQSLEGLKVRRPVVSSSRYHKTFRVTEDDHEARLKLWTDSGGDPGVDLLFGSAPNYRSIHVRLSSEEPVYEVRGIAAYDLRPDRNAWIQKDIVGLAEDQVVGVRLTNAAGTFEIEKQDGTWKVVSPADSKDKQLDQQGVESLVRAAASLRLTEAVGPTEPHAQGLDSPAAKVELRGADAGSVTLEIGGVVAGKDNQRYVTRSGFGFTGTAWDSSVKQLVDEKLDGLLL